jgi:hypothetical protein
VSDNAHYKVFNIFGICSIPKFFLVLSPYLFHLLQSFISPFPLSQNWLNPFSSVPFYLLMKKIEVQMLLHTLTKNFIEAQKNMLNEFGIILFYKVLWWFNGQDIGVKKGDQSF